MYHFVVVFVSILVIYCIAGLVLFGRNTDDFATMDRTLYTVFLCMLGIFDWETLSVVGRVEAGIWLWTFMIIVSLVLLNMLLAIILDSYEEVKEEVGSTLTLFQELNKARKRKLGEHSGILIPVKHVLKLFREKLKELHVEKLGIIEMLEEMKEEKKLNELGQWWNTRSRSWEELPEEYDLSKRDFELPIIKPDTLQFMCNNYLSPVQAHEIVEHAIQAFYDRNYAEPELEKLRSCSENLLYHMKEWKTQVFVNPYEATGPRLPDLTFQIRSRVTPLWQELNCGDDHTLEGKILRQLAAEADAAEADAQDGASSQNASRDRKHPGRRFQLDPDAGERDTEGEVPAWKEKSRATAASEHNRRLRWSSGRCARASQRGCLRCRACSGSSPA